MKRVLGLMATAATALAVVAAPAAAAPDDGSPQGLQGPLDDVVSTYAVGGLAEVRGEHGVWRGSSGVC